MPIWSRIGGTERAQIVQIYNCECRRYQKWVNYQLERNSECDFMAGAKAQVES